MFIGFAEQDNNSAQTVTMKFNPALYAHSPDLILTTDTQLGSLVLTGLKAILEKTSVRFSNHLHNFQLILFILNTLHYDELVSTKFFR